MFSLFLVSLQNFHFVFCSTRSATLEFWSCVLHSGCFVIVEYCVGVCFIGKCNLAYSW